MGRLNDGKTYYCYKGENWDDRVTADVAKYEAYLTQQEELANDELPEVIWELPPEQQAQSDQVLEEANKLHSEWFDELYILFRMYQRGFLPLWKHGIKVNHIGGFMCATVCQSGVGIGMV